MQTVVVTGGAGFLGSHLVRTLLARGHRVRVIDALLFGNGLADIEGSPRLEMVPGDVRNVVELVRVMRGADAVVHLAGIVGDAACRTDPDVTWSLNVEATKLVVDVARHLGLTRLVYASSCSVYGASDDLILNEGSLRRPVSLYAETKIDSEDIVFAGGGDLVVTCLRMATLYGLSPRMRFDLVVNIMTARAVRDRAVTVFGGAQWRPLVHAADAADAFAAVLEARPEVVAGQVFNVGSDEQNFRMRALGERVAACFPGATLDVRPPSDDDLRNYRVSFDKIRHLLGYRATRSVESACAEIGAYLSERPDLSYLDDRYLNHRYPYAMEASLPPKELPRLRAYSKQ